MRRGVFRILVTLTALVLAAAPVAHADPPYRPAGAVETLFSQRGPWPVTAQTGFGCCDSAGAAFDVWYPSNLGTAGVRHPIVTWANGTDAVPRQYAHLLEHLASWGFVVVATEHRNTGSGVEIVDAARHLIDAAADPASVFHDRLNTAAVGAMGHSQGGTGVLNALANSGGLVKTAVPLELPAQAFCKDAVRCADTRRLASGSVLFVNGADDALISPSNQPPWQPAGLQSNRAYYDATPPSVTKAWGTLVRANHNDPQGQPDCARASVPCTTGVYGFLGYPTAWLVAQLWGAEPARGAFAPGAGEFYQPNPNWANQIGAAAG
ncbi:poly(ethylene terephthalate) hydrolase family protein [Nocardia blacklockiae]|uniref:poly(ethylene terephthalate) hydrolase family protein n=1 Tax=Nocardia blacklockiae TaxID=480036 RepID=UPI001892F150|nr:alpha/beta hydrolase [Nocardia blacklockiae]MBF6173892.1 alpha/beta hydrolase [Nocardia blacklockiae]